MNAEIVLGTVRSSDDAHTWLKQTFCWRRALKNPRHPSYGIPVDKPVDAPNAVVFGLREKGIKKDLKLRVVSAIENLVNCYLVAKSPNRSHAGDTFHFESTELGELVSRLSIKFESVQNFARMRLNASISDMLQALSHAAEFAGIQVRNPEKKFLNQLNTGKEYVVRKDSKNPAGISGSCPAIPFPLDRRIQSGPDKVNVLLQASLLHSLDLLRGPEMPSLKSDARIVMASLERLCRGQIGLLTARKDSLGSIRRASLVRQASHHRSSKVFWKVLC